MTVPGEAKLLNLVTEEEVVQVCQQLVRTKSVNPPGDEQQIAEFTAAFLKEAGFEAEVVMHAHGRGSTLAYLKGAGGGMPPTELDYANPAARKGKKTGDN